MAAKGEEPETAERERQSLLSGLLDLELQARAAPKLGIQIAQLVLGLICIGGAFALSFWLVIEGPPKPETASPAASTSEPATTPSSATATSSSSAQGSGNDETSAEPTSTLNEEAPWAFAIIALLVGAFLAAGQSLSFGGGGGGDTQTASAGDKDQQGGGSGGGSDTPSPPAGERDQPGAAKRTAKAGADDK